MGSPKNFPWVLAALLALGLGVPCSGQENPDLPPSNPDVEWTDDRTERPVQRPAVEGEDLDEAQARGEAPTDGVLRPHPVMEAHGSLRPLAIPDRVPLPQGGSGFLFFQLNIPPNRFITSGPEETRLQLPTRVGPLTFGQVEWPEPSGTFRHPVSGTGIPGWTGQIFLKAPLTVDPGAPLEPVMLNVDYQFRVLLIDPPTTSTTHKDPFQVRLEIGPPLPNVQIPPREGRDDATERPPASTPRLTQPRTSADPVGGPGDGMLHRPTSPGAPESTPLEPMVMDLPEPSSGLFTSAPLVFGGAGVLALFALLLLFARRR